METATLAGVLAGATLVGGLHLVNVFLERTADRGTIASSPPSNAGPVADPGPGGHEGTRVCLPVPPPEGVATCGLAPSSRGAGAGTAYSMVTVAGERFWVVLPDDLAWRGKLVAVSDAPIGWIGHPRRAELMVTMDRPASGAARFCEAPRACDPRAVTRLMLPNGAIHTTWDLRSPRPGVPVATIEMGGWVLAFPDDTAPVTEFIARTLRWRLDRGFLRLESPDPTYPIYGDWAGVRILTTATGDPYSLNITPGCDLSAKRPDLGEADAGPRLRVHGHGRSLEAEWCAGGFWVQTRNIDGPALRRLHRELVIRPA